MADRTELQCQRDALAAGWLALQAIDQHADKTTGPFVVFGGRPVDQCLPCCRYTVAVLKGYPPREVDHLRCEDAQRWQAAINVAGEIARKVGDCHG